MFEFKCLPFKAFKFKCLTPSSIQMLRTPNLNSNVNSDFSIARFHSRGQHLCKFIETKENVSIRKEFNSHRLVLVRHQYGRRFIVLEHQYGRRDVMWKHSIDVIDMKMTIYSHAWGGRYPWEYLVGVCRPVLQILIPFQTKTWNFPHPLSD